MAGLDFFSPQEGGDSYDPAAFERFREQMKKNASFTAALKKSEQKQKKKEDALLKILMAFFKRQQKQGLLLLVSRLLEQNMPASFALAIILLGNEELRREAQKEILLLAGVEREERSDNKPDADPQFSLIANFADASIPIRVKVEIDAWGKDIREVVLSNPFKILDTALDAQGMPKSVIMDLMANVLQDYLYENGLKEFKYDTMYSFSEFLIHGILKSAKAQVENQKSLES